jgi:hypothetical protein
MAKETDLGICRRVHSMSQVSTTLPFSHLSLQLADLVGEQVITSSTVQLDVRNGDRPFSKDTSTIVSKLLTVTVTNEI